MCQSHLQLMLHELWPLLCCLGAYDAAAAQCAHRMQTTDMQLLSSAALRPDACAGTQISQLTLRQASQLKLKPLMT